MFTLSPSLLIPLAVTSTNKMMRRLGKNWLRLHKLVYLIAIGAVIHNLLLVKVVSIEPLVYTVCLMILLGSRVLRLITR